jgi:hypothetical protein
MTDPKKPKGKKAARSAGQAPAGHNPDPISAVMATGFPFQMRVERLLRDTKHEHGWTLVGAEFGWLQRSGELGYADLVLFRNSEHLAIECKRHDAEWVFLREHGNLETTTSTFARWRRQDPPIAGVTVEREGWSEVIAAPPSPESSYCVMVGRTGTAKNERLLELDAGLIASAADATAVLLRASLNGPHDLTPHVVIPVIVTTADLSVCDIPTDLVHLETGRLNGKLIQKKPARIVRFRKALGPLTEPRPGLRRSLKEIHVDNQRTVFVVAAEYLVPFLIKFELLRAINQPPPWGFHGEPW